VEMRRRIAGAFYVVLAIAFLYAGTDLLIFFKNSLVGYTVIVGFALGSIRAARLAFDAFRGTADHRIKSI